ncbi:hypothetical protein D3C79_695460 [compost metagenome]
MHNRGHFKLKADVQVSNAFGDHRSLGRRHRRSADDRHPLADMDACLLAVADANHRACQGIDVVVLGVDLGLRRRRNGDARRVDATQLIEGAYGFAIFIEHPEGIGPLQAELEDSRTRDLHHLDFQHHFRIGLVLRLQQFFSHAHRIGGIAHGQGVEAFIDEHISGLEHGLDHVQRGVGVDAGQVKGAHDQFLIVLGLLRRVRVDQQGVVVHHFLVQLVLFQQQRHGIFNAHVLDEDGRLHVRTQVLVEDEIEPGHLRQHLKDGFQVGIAKLQGHRPFHFRAQLRVRLGGAALHQFDVTAQGQALSVLRVELEHFTHVPLGTEQVTATQRCLAEGDALVEVVDLFKLAHRLLGPAVVRLQGQHPAVAHACTREVVAAAVAISLAQ